MEADNDDYRSETSITTSSGGDEDIYSEEENSVIVSSRFAPSSAPLFYREPDPALMFKFDPDGPKARLARRMDFYPYCNKLII